MLAALLTCASSAFAQSLTIVNHNTSYSVTVHMFAVDDSYPNCGDIESTAVTIPASTTYSWCDPVDFQSSGQAVVAQTLPWVG